MSQKITNHRLRRAKRRKAIAEEVRLGSSVDLVARRFNVSISYACEACRDHGVLVGPPQGERVYLLIAQLLGTDRKLAEIAAEAGVSVPYVSRVYQQCRAAGIPVRERLRGRPTKTHEGSGTK